MEVNLIILIIFYFYSGLCVYSVVEEKFSSNGYEDPLHWFALFLCCMLLWPAFPIVSTVLVVHESWKRRKARNKKK